MSTHLKFSKTGAHQKLFSSYESNYHWEAFLEVTMLSLFSQYVCGDWGIWTLNFTLQGWYVSQLHHNPHCFFFVTFILYYKYSQNPNTNDKKIRHKSRFLSLLRLISGIYVVFNLNSIFYVRNNLNDCLPFSHAISLPNKLLEMRSKLLYVFCEIIIFFLYLYISSNVNINSMQFSKVMFYSIKN